MKASETDGGWAWVILVSGFLSQVTSSAVIYSNGIYFVEFLSYFEAKRSIISWISAINLGLYHFTGPLASVLVNKYGCRAVTILGSVVAAVGMFISTFSPNIEVLILTFGALTGVGYGVILIAAYVITGHYFEKRRALAIGLVSCGSSVGLFVGPPLSVFLVNLYGWKGALWVTSAIVLHSSVYGFLFRPWKENDDKKELEEEKREVKVMDWTLFQNRNFLIVAFSQFLTSVGCYMPFVFIPDFSVGLGIPKEKSVWFISSLGIAGLFGRVFFGWMSDKPWGNPLKIYMAVLLTAGGATTLCPWLTTFPLLILYSVIYGMCFGAIFCVNPMILVEVLGIEKFSNSFGIINMFLGIGTVLGPPITGLLFDLTDGYTVSFIVAGSLICSASLVCLPLLVCKKM